MQELLNTQPLIVLELETEMICVASATKAGMCCHCSGYQGAGTPL